MDNMLQVIRQLDLRTNGEPPSAPEILRALLEIDAVDSNIKGRVQVALRCLAASDGPMPDWAREAVEVIASQLRDSHSGGFAYKV